MAGALEKNRAEASHRGMGMRGLLKFFGLAPPVLALVLAIGGGTAVAEKNKCGCTRNESNNTYVRGFSVGPDLIVWKIGAPSTAAPGTTVTVTFTVQNQGATSAPASTLEFFWSTNISLDTIDPSLGTTPVGALAPNGSQSGQMALQIPSDATLGTYYIFAEIDSPNAVAEA